MEGHCGAAVPLISGAEQLQGGWRGVGAGCLSRPVCPPLLPSCWGSYLPSSTHPSFPHPSAHSLPSFHVSGDPLTEPQAPTPYSHPSSHLYPFQHNPASSGLACGAHRLGCCGPECCSLEGTPEKTPAHGGARRWSPWEGSGAWAEWGRERARALWAARSPRQMSSHRGRPAPGHGTTSPGGAPGSLTGCVGPTEPSPSSDPLCVLSCHLPILRTAGGPSHG